ncbi:MAG: TIGR02594 family protein [Roseibium sp.]|uniref:TIGR02594 family protein n=1 Tax=Roseibium polysiphoniae TaxID=2571221 RepID=UPI00329703AE
MYYRAKKGIPVFYYISQPSDPLSDSDITNSDRLSTSVVLKATSEDPSKTWFKVTAQFLSGDKEVWVKASDLEPIDPPEPEALVPWSFVKNCTLAARVINKANETTGFGINRDFMIAYALVHTGTETESIPQNITKSIAGETRHGPFSLTVEEWATFIGNGAANTDEYIDRDINETIFQCYGFAHLVLSATETLSSHFSTNDTSQASGPWIPTTIELFMCLACGKGVAVEFIDKLENAPATKIADIIKQTAGARATILHQRYKRFFGTPDEAFTIESVHKKLKNAFDTALKRSFTLVREHTPEDLIYVLNGPLPWFVKAREELVKNVRETGTPPNPEVMKYFSATGYSTTKEDPWCGAFVAWCLANSGSDIAAKSVRKATAARAASWKTWGDVEVPIGAHEKSAVPVGAIVVLRPREGTTDSSGHVGFFVEQDAKKIRLLGGNQSDSVKISEYDRSKVVAIRMLKGFDAAPAQSSGPGTQDPNFNAGTLGPFTSADWAKFIDLLGHRESTNNYKAVNRLGYAGRWQFGALALIDAGYVKSGAKTRLLAESRWWRGTNGINSREDWLNNKNNCQDEAMVSHTRRNYRSLLNNRDSRKVIEVILNNADKAALAGILATAHLLGAGGARKMLNGQDGQDANGVKGRDYYKLLAEAFGGNPNPPQI